MTSLINHGISIYNEVDTSNSPGEFYVTQSNQTQFILYTHPDCAFSAAAKMDYRKRKVDFVEIDVSKQKEKIPELQQLTGGGKLTPVMVENGNVIIGFKGNT